MRPHHLPEVTTPPAFRRRGRLVGVVLCLMFLGCPASPPDPVPAPAPHVVTAPAPAAEPAPVPQPPVSAAAGGVTVPSKPLGSCEDVRAAYKNLLTTAEHTRCSADTDCQIVSGECAIGLSGCYHAVNQAVTQAAVSALGARFQQLGCSGPVCRCMRPPAAHCNQGSCGPP